MSSVWSRIIFCSVMLLGCGVMVSAQNARINPKFNSPYSRFGLGDAVNPYFTSMSGFAGLGATYQDHSHINLVNPASLASMRFTALEVGLYARYSALEAGGQEENVWSGNLNYLALGFPLKNSINQALDRQRDELNWGMAFALMPYTNVGYDVLLEDEVTDSGTFTNSLKGTGGTYKIMWGNGWSYKGVSVGANLGYLFGKITNSRRVALDSLELNAYATELEDAISVGGVVWDVGVQYTYDFKKRDRTGKIIPSGKRIVVGAYGNNTTNFTTKTSRLYHRDNFAITGTIDTILYQDEFENDGKLPTEFGVGIMYHELNRLRLGIDYSAGLWSEYENDVNPESLKDNFRLAVGGEYIPDATSYNSYWKRVHYRLGGFYGTDPRAVNGDQLETYGFTMGLSLPVTAARQQTSYLDFGLEIGQFGLNDVIRENYVQMTLGFTLNDNTWFFKRKFN